MTHGGKRKGAGRKPSGKVRWFVSTEPKTKRIIHSLAKKQTQTPGEVLDAHYQQINE